MIQSTKGKLAANAVKGKYGKGFPGDLVKRTRAMLSALDAAVVVEDLRFPPGNHLEELKGDRAGQHSVRINALPRSSGDGVHRVCAASWRASDADRAVDQGHDRDHA